MQPHNADSQPSTKLAAGADPRPDDGVAGDRDSANDRLLDLMEIWEDRYYRGRELSAESLAVNDPALLQALKCRIEQQKRLLDFLKIARTSPLVAPSSEIARERPNKDQNAPAREQPGPETLCPTLDTVPATIGRYRVAHVLGQGGFGRVYLAHDPDLDRDVAIKVPIAGGAAHLLDVEAYLREARILARLAHPNIVPVYDIGRTGDGQVYVVSKYMDGGDLAARLRLGRFSFTESAALVAVLCDALHYTHTQDLFHRDIKPANILLDAAGAPSLADFGLALKDENVGQGAGHVGTAAYMSPEQARGEGHLVDGRSDVFSIGIVMYELLTGRRPFRGRSHHEVIEQIKTIEPRPPRQIDDAIPSELERICLKALSKRASERYTTARDLAEDLRHLQRRARAVPARDDATQIPATVMVPSGAVIGVPPAPPSTPSDLTMRSVKIVPKGLRAFDEHDADFFLELLPGPRDRDGLPESLRFWKTRVEECDPEQTFRAGLIYGPSGCGKSSLVRAGLLPRLARHVQTVYVDAGPADIEHRMLRALQRRCPELPTNLDLPHTVAALRRGRIIRPGHKIVIVLDQFEQWLHAGTDSEDGPLVRALRQCDGEHVQALVLVRDDFWLAASRFLRNLDVRLLEGFNAAHLDLFDPRHARRVLAMLGRAFGALSSSHGLTRDEDVFLDQAIAGLAHDSKIFPVRLALFAEMLKSKPWTMATLRAIGGTEGVGVTFLDETFSAPTAPAEHRRHQEAARAILKSLIPTTGADIKGQVRTRMELLDASGYAERPLDFDNVIRILDSELRLITPTDSSDQTDVGRTGAQAEGSCYLLAHDYLVHSLREWLNRKQRESRAGRAELCLAERTALWTGRSENRLLPSLGEWLQIRSATRSNSWSLAEGAMMAAADRFHVVRIATSAFVVLAIVILLFASAAGVSAWRRRSEVSALVAQLFVAEWPRLPNVLRSLDAERALWADEVERIFADRLQPPGERQRARLLLARHSEARACELIDDISSANPAQLTVITGRLVPWKTRVLPLLWSRLTAADVAPDARVRLAATAARLDPSNPLWNSVAHAVSLALLEEADPLVLSAWVEFLHPVENSIAEPLAAICLDTRIEIERRQEAAAILAEIGNNRPDLLERVLLECDSSRQFVVLSRKLATKSQSFAAHMHVVLSEGPAPNKTNSEWPRLANAALALAQLGDWSAVWPSLGESANPSLRTRLIHRMRDYGVSVTGLVAGLSPAQTPSVRQAILMALRNYRPESIPLTERTVVLDYCERMFVTDPDAGVHAGCELLLRAWGQGAGLPALESRILVRTPVGNWYMTGQGHLMVAFAHPGRFSMGSPATESRRDDVETAHARLIDRGFAIGAHEVTVAQFARFRPNFDHAVGNLSDPDCPANKISLFDAFAYCRWLTSTEGMTEDQQCYPPEIGPSMKLPDDFLSRTGYRLPTEAEWEFGARAGSTTSRFFGEDTTLLTSYAWFIVNSDDYLWPVARLLPNRYGLYDVYGNVMEWCQGQFGPYPPVVEGHAVSDNEFRIDFNEWPVLRGGCYRSTVRENRSAKRVYEPAAERFSFVGMRLARTLPVHFFAAVSRKSNP